MKNRFLYGMAGFFILALLTIAWVTWRQNPGAAFPVATPSLPGSPPALPYLVAAPGRVEPLSEEVKVGTEIPGRIHSVLVKEGEDVQHNQVLALLDSREYEAQLSAAKARLGQAQAELRRLLNGARQEERREVQAAVAQAEAVLRNAAGETARRQTLLRRGYMAREEVERSERDLQVARARFQEARERYALVTASAREEDQARAQATLVLAQAQVQEAQVRFDKTVIRSPLAGTVLRKYVHLGEMVSPEAPLTGMFLVADLTTLRVRASIDETDIGKFRVGHEAYVTATAYGETKFRGRVVYISQLLGKKHVRTDEPTERIDTKGLEVLIDLESSGTLVPGLRVDVFITARRS